MTDVDAAVRYLTTWAWQKARRIGGRIDLDLTDKTWADLERLHRVIAAQLAGEPVLGQLLFEPPPTSHVPAVRPLTAERVRLALQNAIEDDPGSAVRLHTLVEDLHRLTARHPVTVSVATSTDRSVTMAPNSP